MWFNQVTVVMLFALLSSGNTRPRNPDPLDSSSSHEIVAEILEPVNRSRTLDSRYMMMKTQVSTTSVTSNPWHDITSVKYDNSNNKSNEKGLSMFSGFSIEAERKNYLPFSVISYVTSRSSNNLKSINRLSRQLIDTNSNNYIPLPIPLISSSQASIILPTPQSISQKNEVIIKNSTSTNERSLFLSQINKSKFIPLLSKTFQMVHSNSILRDKRMISRNFVRIIPQKLKLGYNIRRNSTNFKNKPQITNVELKNWPNEALQNVQDLLDYEKYTSFTNGKFKVPVRKFNTSSNQKVQYPQYWLKIPMIEALSASSERINMDSTMNIDNLLDDLRNNNINKQQYENKSEFTQNTVFHILNVDSKKQNMTLNKPIDDNNIDRIRIGNNRPPQNVHVMLMTDNYQSLLKNDSTGQYIPFTQNLGLDINCPTIMINSITQINNTIESKESCTDLNIIINSHILNTNIFKHTTDSPIVSLNNSHESVKNPYSDTAEMPFYDHPNNISSNNDYNNYNIDYKESVNQLQPSNLETLESVEPVSEISAFEIFQGTHINIGENDQAIKYATDNIEDENFFNIHSPDQFMGTEVNGLPLLDSEDGNNIFTVINAVEDNSATQVNLFSEVASSVADVETGQANDALGTISLPSLPNLLTVSGQLINASSSLGTGNSNALGNSGQTNLSATSILDLYEDDEELLYALSPVELLESISSVFSYFNVLNPINYGIFGLIMAPFIAFAAGILGIAVFLFPWAFPGNLDFSRGWNDNSSKIKTSINTSFRDIVQSSIYKYKYINEWKRRRRKRKKKK